MLLLTLRYDHLLRLRHQNQIFIDATQYTLHHDNLSALINRSILSFDLLSIDKALSGLQCPVCFIIATKKQWVRHKFNTARGEFLKVLELILCQNYCRYKLLVDTHVSVISYKSKIAVFNKIHFDVLFLSEMFPKILQMWTVFWSRRCFYSCVAILYVFLKARFTSPFTLASCFFIIFVILKNRVIRRIKTFVD